MDHDVIKFLERIESLNPSSGNQNANGFNVFSLCQVWHKETIHSAILASLLDPKEEHGLGTMPLKLFFSVFLGINLNATQLIGARVTTEELININGRQRRLDILIRGKNFRVIIENKTVTCDHEGQLDDYYDWLRLKEHKEQNKKLLYLTYNGSDAVNVKTSVYTRIAYNSADDKSIVLWLDNLANEIKDNDKNFLKKTIIQYKDFLKILTEEGKMAISDELAENIIEHFSTAIEIVQNINKAKAHWLQNNIFNKLSSKGFKFDRNVESMYRDNDICFWYESNGKKIEYAFNKYGFIDPRREVYELDGQENGKLIEKCNVRDMFNWNDEFFCQISDANPDEIANAILQDAKDTAMRDFS